MTGWLCCERGMSEWLQHRDGCAKRKTLMGRWASEWADARLEHGMAVLPLGKAPAMPGLSCWGTRGPKSSHLPAGVSGISPPLRFSFSPVTGGAWGELPFPAGCCSLPNHPAKVSKVFLEHSCPRDVPSATQLGVCGLLCSQGCMGSVTPGHAVPPLTW